MRLKLLKKITRIKLATYKPNWPKTDITRDR